MLDQKDLEAIQQLLEASEQRTGQRIDAMQAQMDQRFDAMQAQMDRRFEAVDQKFDAMQAQMDRRFEAVDQRFDAMQAQMDRRFEEVDQRFETMEDHITKNAVLMMDMEFSKRFDLLAENQDVIIERLDKLEELINPTRMEKLEDDVAVLKLAVRQLNEDVRELKAAK